MVPAKAIASPPTVQQIVIRVPPRPISDSHSRSTSTAAMVQNRPKLQPSIHAVPIARTAMTTPERTRSVSSDGPAGGLTASGAGSLKRWLPP